MAVLTLRRLKIRVSLSKQGAADKYNVSAEPLPEVSKGCTRSEAISKQHTMKINEAYIYIIIYIYIYIFIYVGNHGNIDANRACVSS